MIKHEVTYYSDFKIKSTREYKDDKLVIQEEYDVDGNLIYKEDSNTICIIEYLSDGKTKVFLENKLKNTWERFLYDNDDNKLLSERSNGTWHETRYNEKGRKTFFLNCYGSIHYHDERGNIKYEDFDEPELICSYELNFEKTHNKFGGLFI